MNTSAGTGRPDGGELDPPTDQVPADPAPAAATGSADPTGSAEPSGSVAPEQAPGPEATAGAGQAPWNPGPVGAGPGFPAPGTGAPDPVGGTSLGDRVAAFRLRRSATDKMLGGVCGGLAADLGVDAALLRIGVLVLTLATGGAFALVYLAAWLIAPVS